MNYCLKYAVHISICIERSSLDFLDCTEIDINSIERAGITPLLMALSVTKLYGVVVLKRQSRWWTFALCRLLICKLFSEAIKASVQLLSSQWQYCDSGIKLSLQWKFSWLAYLTSLQRLQCELLQ